MPIRGAKLNSFRTHQSSSIHALASVALSLQIRCDGKHAHLVRVDDDLYVSLLPVFLSLALTNQAQEMRGQSTAALYTTTLGAFQHLKNWHGVFRQTLTMVW